VAPPSLFHNRREQLATRVAAGVLRLLLGLSGAAEDIEIRPFSAGAPEADPARFHRTVVATRRPNGEPLPSARQLQEGEPKAGTTSARGTALVTGASSGIGAVYAHRLARRGYDLILVARNNRRLDGLAARLGNETGQTVAVVAADLTDKADLTRVESLLRGSADITVLVNNAGISAAGPLLSSDVDEMDAIIALNVIALTRLTYAAAPGFVTRGGGTIINIGSILGITPEVLNGVYGATKAFVLAFTLSLHKELAEKNVRVQAVLPGATATDLWAKIGIPVGHLPSEIVMQADDMVDAALAGLDQGELVTIPSLPDVADWQAYEAGRQKLIPNLSLKVPAARYRAGAAARI
jgi:short-subunit dehydrogenase